MKKLNFINISNKRITGNSVGKDSKIGNELFMISRALRGSQILSKQRPFRELVPWICQRKISITLSQSLSLVPRIFLSPAYITEMTGTGYERTYV